MILRTAAKSSKPSDIVANADRRGLTDPTRDNEKDGDASLRLCPNAGEY